MLTLTALQNLFVRRMPSMEKTAKIAFRHLPPEAKEESICNAIGLTWKAIYGLFLQERAHEPGMIGACLRFSIRQTREGRTPQGCPRKRDTLSRRWVGPTRLDDFDLGEFVGRSTPVPDAVSFKVDVPQFLDSLTERQRNLALDLATGMSTTEAAAKHGLSLGRISQYRREFKDKFDIYFAD